MRDAATTSIDVIVARPPKDAGIVGVVVGLEMTVDPEVGAERIRAAAENLRAAGLGLMLSPELLEVKRRPWWRPDRTTKEVHN
ncbi:MAG TPA: hypothetical protein VMP13_06265 [Acidimicrobiia bacterium]|nr:hypothetical protein [Acidimicrobiia bacterium]